MSGFLGEINTSVLYIFVLITIIYFLIYYVLRYKLLKASFAISKQSDEIKKQHDEHEKLNQKLFASSLKIDQQNFELKLRNDELKKQKANVVKKTVELLVVNREQRMNLKLRDGLTDMIVHDLKNPISNILNLSESKEITFFANEILTMVENILDVKKHEGIMMSLKKDFVPLHRIAVNAIKQISLFAERKNIKIINKISRSIIVYADEEIIKRVIVNFLSNSIKYSYPNGKIVINVRNLNDGRITVDIVDSGVGIEKDKIHLIFDKFSQVMIKKTGSARSSGLGLTFCKIAVQSHGGVINVKSVPGKYTIFSFDVELYNKQFLDDDYDISDKLNVVKLTDKDKQYLKQFYKQLNEHEVYEIGKLRKILNHIDDNFSETLLAWKTEINKAIYNCNFELYKNITNMIN